MSKIFLALLLLTLCLQACGKSSPTNYYALSSNINLQTQDRLPKTTLRLARVAIPPYLDRETIVTKKPDQVQLAVDSVQVWAEPLSDGVRRILQNELAAPLLEHNITVLPLASESSGTYTLLIDILRLDGQLGSKVNLSAQWSLVTSQANQTLDDGIFSAEQVLTEGSYQELVAAESILLQNFAKHLLNRLPLAMRKGKN